MKKNWFKKTNKGFSLVELIVVIAIMAILVGVAVPVYGSYIEKTQKAADVQLVDEIKHAMEIANAAQTLTESAYVKIDAKGVVEVDGPGKAQLEAVLEATFGDDLSSLKLKYDGWKGVSSTVSYKNSSYNGKEGELINVVDGLTNALGSAVIGNEALANEIMGGDFGKLLKDYGIAMDDGEGIGNAAVLYVAQVTTNKKVDLEAAFDRGLQNVNKNFQENQIPIDDPQAGTIFMMTLQSELEGVVGQAAALAAVYAYAEGYAQYIGEAETFNNEVDFDENTTDVDTAMGKIINSFNKLRRDQFVEYAYGDNAQGTTDLRGYIEAMENVYNYQDAVSENLTNPDCFTDGVVDGLLKNYAAMSKLGVTTNPGEVAVIVSVDEQGAAQTYVAPLDWDK